MPDEFGGVEIGDEFGGIAVEDEPRQVARVSAPLLPAGKPIVATPGTTFTTPPASLEETPAIVGWQTPLINPRAVKTAIDIGSAGMGRAPIVEGFREGAAQQLAGFTSPESIAMAPAFAVPVVGPALALGLGAKAVGTGLGTTVGALESGNMAEAGQGLSEVVGGGTMLLGGGHQAFRTVRPEIPPVIPGTGKPVPKDVPQQLEKAIEPEPIKPGETEAEATARFRKETEDAAREMIAEEVARIDATKLKGAEDVAAQQLTKLLRRAGRFPALRPALPEAFKKVADAAREQGADLDAVQRGIGAEMQSIYGADAPEMVEFYFGKGKAPEASPVLPAPEPPIVPKPTEQSPNTTILFHGAEGGQKMLQPGAMWTEKKEWAQGYSRGQNPTLYQIELSNQGGGKSPFSNPIVLRGTVSDAEAFMGAELKRLGIKAGSINDAATKLGQATGNDGIIAVKDGRVTGMMNLKEVAPDTSAPFTAPEPPVAKPATSAEAPAPAQPATPTTQPGLPLDVESVARQPKGIASGVRAKWTSATESPLGGEGGFISLAPIEDFLSAVTKGVKGMGRGVKSAYDMTRAAAKENFELAKTSDYRRAILHWSAKMQRSFSEAEQAQRELRSVIKEPIRRDAATNWIQAGGDPVVLQNRLRATIAWRDPVTGKPHPEARRLIAGYEAALNLTPEEIAAATDAKNAYAALGARGAAHDVLKSFKDNYVTQVWDLKQGPTGGNTGMGFGARTLKERFRFSKASTFPTYFDGEQAGFVPKTKDISNLLPMYLHEMNNVIAARQLVEQLSKGVASDGRPLIAPRGTGIAVDNAQGKATLILPDVMKADTEGYVRMENQPALHDWQWQTKDSAGKPVLMKSDLVVHPEAASHFKNVLGKSAIKEWYESKTSASAEIPKAIMKSIDQVQSETKKAMLGLLSPFHQVQEGTHAIGHRVNPFFNNPTIDFVNNPAQMDAARHGLMLQPDRVSAQQFMEGFKQSGIVSKIPGLGPLADHYQHYLFHEYIPGIKFKTYEAIVERNMKVFAKDLASGKVTREDVKILSAEQANAAYGHLNYADLGRNPTVQHLMRLGLLAPDFLEARARFTGQAIKGLAGGKVGREQLIALATLAVAQAALSFISAKLTGGEWDAKDPFTFHVGNRKFTMRSVPEDFVRFANDTRAFTYARLNPIVGRGAAQYVTGVDWRGRKVSAGQTTKELLQQPIPLTLRPLFGIGNTPLSGWEELAGAAGLKISRYSNVAEMSKMAHEWMDKSTDPRIKAAEQQSKQETLPESLYKPLREALIKNDFKTARMELKKLEEIRKPSEIQRAMHMQRPFTGSLSVEQKFKASLTPNERLKYEAARREQTELYQKFLKLK